MSLPSVPHYIRLDLFPAYVTRPGEAQPFSDRVRVIVGDQDFYIFSDSPTGPVCDITEVLYDATGTPADGYHLIAEDGGDYFVRRSTNCGCGSRLRGYRPFPGVPYSRF